MRTVIFLSNFFNHHQKPFSDAMYQRLGEGYLFLETEKMSEERRRMGWGSCSVPAYVISCEAFQQDRERYLQRINQADAVIIGSAPHALVTERIAQNKLTFRCTERQLKKGLELWKYPYRFLTWHRRYPPQKQVYLLCASAYAAADYAKFLLFRGKSFKWGYFPETRQYDNVEELIRNKTKNSLIWVARYLDWKHPEIAVEIGQRLKREGYSFHLTMIGNGEKLEEIRQMVTAEGLDDVIKICGAMTPEEVRTNMETSQIHIFTSDQQEGWGAVLNEAMNSACVSIADRRIGSAPYLIEDGVNGFAYSGVEDLYGKVKFLLDHPGDRERMAQNAYATIAEHWNAENAAARLLDMIEKRTAVYESGVCSKA